VDLTAKRNNYLLRSSRSDSVIRLCQHIEAHPGEIEYVMGKWIYTPKGGYVQFVDFCDHLEHNGIIEERPAGFDGTAPARLTDHGRACLAAALRMKGA
jgi:hypothetical protein